MLLYKPSFMTAAAVRTACPHQPTRRGTASAKVAAGQGKVPAELPDSTLVVSDPFTVMCREKVHDRSQISLADAIARPWTYERDPRGALGLLADRDRGVLAGAWAVAPLASEWIHQAALAIRAQIPISVLLDQVAQFPTYSEAYLAALEKLGW